MSFPQSQIHSDESSSKKEEAHGDRELHLAPKLPSWKQNWHTLFHSAIFSLRQSWMTWRVAHQRNNLFNEEQWEIIPPGIWETINTSLASSPVVWWHLTRRRPHLCLSQTWLGDRFCLPAILWYRVCHQHLTEDKEVAHTFLYATPASWVTPS